MLEAVLRELNNWFVRSSHSGYIVVRGGSIVVPDGFLSNGQHFCIVGSVFNDGLHVWPCTDLEDEGFEGVVQALAIPKAVIELADSIKAWEDENGDSSRAPYASESFGGYSYSMQSGEERQTWQRAFQRELNRWRKL